MFQKRYVVCICKNKIYYLLLSYFQIILYIHIIFLFFIFRVYEEADEYCPHCDNHYVIEAKTPQKAIGVEGEDARMDNR